MLYVDWTNLVLFLSVSFEVARSKYLACGLRRRLISGQVGTGCLARF